MKRYGLIGSPLSHSFSKKYFEDKFRRENITGCAYELFPIASIDELPVLLKRYPDLHGLNVTIPYKQSVIPFLDSIENLPEGLHACNCIKIENHKLVGFNTDVIGFWESFRKQLKDHHKKALILGSGGAAAAVAYCLRSHGIDYLVVSRNPGKGPGISYRQVDEDLLDTHHIVINTTPLGMYPDEDQCPDLPYHALTPRHYLFDLIYNPARTLFLQKGEEQGAVVRNGEEMLVLQAEESWRIWRDKRG